MPRINHPDSFPDLRFSQLERYAERWAKKFKDLPIERILLFHYSSKFEEHYDFENLISQKYAIVFEFSHNQTSPYWEIMHSDAGSFDPSEYIQALEKPTQFDEFIRVIGLYKTERHIKYKGLIDSGFTSVYKSGEKPKDAKEMVGKWHLTFSMPKDGEIYGHEPNANVRTDEDKWILYEARNISWNQRERISTILREYKCKYKIREYYRFWEKKHELYPAFIDESATKPYNAALLVFEVDIDPDKLSHEEEEAYEDRCFGNLWMTREDAQRMTRDYEAQWETAGGSVESDTGSDIGKFQDATLKDPFNELDLDALRQQVNRWLENSEEMFGCRVTAIKDIKLYTLEPTQSDPCRYEIRTSTLQIEPQWEKKYGEWVKNEDLPSIPAGDVALDEKEIEGVYREKPTRKSFMKEWRHLYLRPRVKGPSRDGRPLAVLYEKSATDDSPDGPDFTTLFNEAGRCYDVFKKLKTDDSLSDESWTQGIKRLGLEVIIPGDIVGISLHQGHKDQKRNIVCQIVKSALKRIYPGVNYTIEELNNIRTGKPANRT